MKNAALYKFRERRRTKQTQPNSKPLAGHASLSHETKHFMNGVHPIYEPPPQKKNTDSKEYVTTCEYLRASDHFGTPPQPLSLLHIFITWRPRTNPFALSSFPFMSS